MKRNIKIAIVVFGILVVLEIAIICLILGIRIGESLARQVGL